jgi:hypothetical protein
MRSLVPPDVKDHRRIALDQVMDAIKLLIRKASSCSHALLYRSDQLVDGLDNNERVIGTIGVRRAIDSIQEVRILTNSFSADGGRASPGALPISNANGFAVDPQTGNGFGIAPQLARNASLIYTHTFTPNLLSTVGAAWTFINNASYPLNYGLNPNTKSGQANVNVSQLTSGLAVASPTGLVGLGGDSNSVPLQDKDNTYQINGRVIYSHGNHSFRMGAALIRRNALNLQDNQGEGSWILPHWRSRGVVPASSNPQFFRASAFVPQAPGTLGNERRNPLHGPHFRHWDMSLFKDFPVYRETRLQFRAEAFNIANQASFSNPTTSLGTAATFGALTSTLPSYQPRLVQLALKYQF